MVNVKLVINDKPLRNLLMDYNKRVRAKTKRTEEDIARKAVLDIRKFMPKDTGESRKSMWYLLAFSDSKSTQIQITQWMLPHPEKTWAGEWFNLPLYMFGSENFLIEKGVSNNLNFRTGDIKKMREVPDKIMKQFETEVIRDLAEQWQLSK